MRRLEYFRRSADGISLAVFRILFGSAMAWEAFRLWSMEGRFLAKPRFHFTYPFFEFIVPWLGTGTAIQFAIMGIAALGIALGLYYRVSLILFLLTYAWFFLTDKVLYNNHYYLLLLVALLLLWTQAHCVLSIDAWRHKRKGRAPAETVPAWNLFLLRAQFLLVFFFGGLAKIDPDWLRGEPLRLWLPRLAHSSMLKPLLLQSWAPAFFSYCGVVFDLSIAFLLIWRKTRPWAILAAIVFNIMNTLIFPIGIFPMLMIASLVLFVDPGLLRRALRKQPFAASETFPEKEKVNLWITPAVALYLAVQILVPVRHWFYPGDVNWTEEGHRFSWRMMLRDKQSRIRMTATDPATGETREIRLRDDLNGRQVMIMAGFPDMIHQYAQYFKEKRKTEGAAIPRINVEDSVSLNGRPSQLLIDPTADLGQVSYPVFSHASWILPGPTDRSPH